MGVALEMFTEFILGEQYELRFLRFGDVSGFCSPYEPELVGLAETKPFDLIMPYWQGAGQDLLVRLKAQHRKPIVLVTGWHDDYTALERAGIPILKAPFLVEDCRRVLQEALTAENELRPTRRCPPRIVIVDDVSWFLELVTVAIRGRFVDFNLLTFNNSNDALAELSQNKPDLLILGMQPIGVEILPLLVKARAPYPIVLTSGFWKESDARRLAGPELRFSFLAKPFTLDELYQQLLTHLGQAWQSPCPRPQPRQS